MPKANTKEILFKCTSCNFEERIPIESVYFFDIFNPNDIDSPPCTPCTSCAGTMIPAARSK
jgi:hypothetical protein